MSKPDKWERRRQRQAFLNRCARSRKFAPQLTALTSRKIWDRAGKLAQSELAQQTRESDSTIACDSAQSPIAENNQQSHSAIATN